MSDVGRATDRACPVCGSSSHYILHHHRLRLPDQYPQRQAFDIRCCGSCGATFSTGAAPSDEMEAYYSTQLEFRPGLLATATGSASPWWERDRLQQTAAALLKHVGDPLGSILDVGCGNGALLSLFRDHGFRRVCGVDPSPAAVAQGLRAGLDLRLGTATDLPTDLPPADLVLLSHVVEHLIEPGHALASVVARMSPGSKLYVEVPDVTRLHEHVRLPFIEFSTEHVNYFSEASLSALASRFGLSQVAVVLGDFVLQPGITYPSLGMLFRLDTRSVAREADSVSRPALERYVARSQDVIAHIDVRLDRLVPSENVAVRGLGDLAWNLLANTRLAERDVVRYLDSNPDKQRLTIGGRAVEPPYAETLNGLPVVILSLLHERAIVDDMASHSVADLAVPLSRLLPTTTGADAPRSSTA